MFRQTMTSLVFFSLAACGTDSDQTVTGRVSQGSFLEPITQVRAIGTESTIATRVAADGSFELTLPAGDRYRIELVSSTRSPDLVHPRASGEIGTSFTVESSTGTLDLGAVHYIKDGDGTLSADTAIPDNPLADRIRDTGTGGGQDTGTGGGQDTGGGGQDTGTGGGG
jgi:hypothetical protein